MSSIQRCEARRIVRSELMQVDDQACSRPVAIFVLRSGRLWLYRITGFQPGYLALSGGEVELLLKSARGGRPRKIGSSIDVRRALFIRDLNDEALLYGKKLTDEQWLPILRKHRHSLFPPNDDKALCVSISKGRKELGISSPRGRAQKR